MFTVKFDEGNKREAHSPLDRRYIILIALANTQKWTKNIRHYKNEQTNNFRQLSLNVIQIQNKMTVHDKDKDKMLVSW